MNLKEKIVIASLYYFYKAVGIIGLWLAKLLVKCPDNIIACSNTVGKGDNRVKIVNVQIDKVGLLLDYTNRATLILKHIWDEDIKGGGFNVTKLMEYIEPFHVLYLDYLNHTNQLVKKEIKVVDHQAFINGKQLNFNNVSL